MTGQSDVVAPSHADHTPSEVAQLYQEGFVAGVLGAATIALWFLLLDTLHGRPFYTPSVLGDALFRAGKGLESPDALPISFNMVVVVTWVHVMVFCVLGGAASRLLAVAERRPNLGFGILLLFVVFEFGFIIAAMIVAQPVLQALDWSAILVGNLLAAAAMTAYFWRRHPHLRIEP